MAVGIYPGVTGVVSHQPIPFEDSKPDVATMAPAPVAVVEDISLIRLQMADPMEEAKLLQAGTGCGVFHLNLLDAEGRPGRLLAASEAIYDLAEELFSLEEEQKLAYDVDHIGGARKLNGYKPVGRNHGGNGNRDGFESYAISKDTMLGLNGPGAATAQHPAVVARHAEALREFTSAVNEATTAILHSFSRTLGLAGGAETLAQRHRAEVPSSDMLRLLKYHAQQAGERGAPQSPHTDLGSLTVLFSKQPGLQIKREEEDEGEEDEGGDGWRFVNPSPGRAVVNLGDAMALLSNGRLRSCLHRVVPLPGRPMATRYSFAYMRRPEDDTPMVGLKGELVPESASFGPRADVMTAGQWLLRKFGALRFDSHEPDEGWVLTSHTAQ
ncbi:hypothetical protein SLS58_002936 [Diplodia intermedia]|uniref:Fe2OG dioxygenase domain-containing protein n=1 Tax=Diplodia intermedia TaxID=856260 RepID=A0ABR3TY20_9PEZI